MRPIPGAALNESMRVCGYRFDCCNGNNLINGDWREDPLRGTGSNPITFDWNPFPLNVMQCRTIESTYLAIFTDG